MFHLTLWPTISLMLLALAMRYIISRLAQTHQRLNRFISSSWPQFIIIFVLSAITVILNIDQVTPSFIFWLIIFNIVLDAIIFWLNLPEKHK